VGKQKKTKKIFNDKNLKNDDKKIKNNDKKNILMTKNIYI
jgi:hypothetical protein